MSDLPLVSGLQLIEVIVAAVRAGPGRVMLQDAADVPVIALIHGPGVVVKAESGSVRGAGFLAMAEKGRIVSAEQAATVRDLPEPMAALVAQGVLSQSAVDALSAHVASVDLGRFLADKRQGRVVIELAAEGEAPSSPGVAIVEFVKQAVIVSGNVGAILDAGSLEPGGIIDRGDAFADAIDLRSRQFLDTVAPQLPLPIHEALALAGDDLTRRKFAAIIVVAAATGHVKRAAPLAVAPVRPAAVARLSSMTGVIALDLAQELPPRAGTGSMTAAIPRTGSMTATLPRTSSVASGTVAGELAGPVVPPLSAPRGATGEFRSAHWRKETLAEHQARRAAELNLDLSQPDNATSLEREYLSIVVPRGLAAGAVLEVLDESKRWLALAPQDPTAVVSHARIRFGADPRVRPDVVAALAEASAQFSGVIDVQWAFFELARAIDDQARLPAARRRFLALASPTDPRRPEVENEIPSSSSSSSSGSSVDEVKVGAPDSASLTRSAAAIVVVPLVLGAAIQTLGLPDIRYFPSLAWFVRVLVLALAAGVLIVAGGEAQRKGTLQALQRVDPLWLITAVIGGAIAQAAIVVLFGNWTRPNDLVFEVAVATFFVYALTERSFFHLAVAPLSSTESTHIGYIGLSALGQVFMTLTYGDLWYSPVKLVMWCGVAVGTIALPCSLLWLKTRTFYAPLAWQVAMTTVQVALLAEPAA
jgi:hypothetical protein